MPVENILGIENDGFNIAVEVLNSGRFSMGSICAAKMRSLLSMICILVEFSFSWIKYNLKNNICLMLGFNNARKN